MDLPTLPKITAQNEEGLKLTHSKSFCSGDHGLLDIFTFSDFSLYSKYGDYCLLQPHKQTLFLLAAKSYKLCSRFFLAALMQKNYKGRKGKVKHKTGEECTTDPL